MKRLDFIREMQSSLFKTVRSVYEPFLAEDVEKLERAADKALGLQWHHACTSGELSSPIEQKFINGKPVILIKSEGNMRAFSGICPACSNLLILSTLYSSGKCVICEKDYNFLTGEGSLYLEEYPVREQDGSLQICCKRILLKK
ncbi:hypothetical protein [Mesobacillus zeae]|uniref:Rieske domain-containing protein n=1 Tax=Mesobacillus zeae TaxID=1917180 RepID=A0A398B2P1_9BACI|nr:hypothetical protein [Mesobacillus zeae]RID84137.1 hypothetical protein D1970_13535 [Mesobacillus zeae]